MAELYLLPTFETALIPEDFFKNHFPLRAERAKQYRRRDNALLCLGVGALIHTVFGIDESDIAIEKYGKPYSPAIGRDFSVSHSGIYTILATGNDKIGCDIEIHGTEHSGVAKRVFTDDELEWMKIDEQNRFYTLWTLKESVMKVSGKGFGIPPTSFSVLNIINGSPISLQGTTVFGQVLPIFDDYSISVCGSQKPDVTNPVILTHSEII